MGLIYTSWKRKKTVKRDCSKNGDTDTRRIHVLFLSLGMRFLLLLSLTVRKIQFFPRCVYSALTGIQAEIQRLGDVF
jgi:hypothetical protein